MEQLQAALARAQAAHADAVANKINVASKLATATALHREAVEARKILVAPAASGGALDGDALECAQKNIAKADTEVKFWADAQAGAAATVVAAEKPVTAAQEAIGKRRFVLVVKGRLAAADRLDRAGRELVEAYHAWTGTTAEFEAIRTAGRIRLGGDMPDKNQGFRVIPHSGGIHTQWGVSSFPHEISLGQLERGTLGHWANLADAVDEATPTA